MKGEHDAKDGPEQADVRRVGGDRADDDEALGQRDFQRLLARKLSQIDPAVEQPAFHRDGDATRRSGPVAGR